MTDWEAGSPGGRTRYDAEIVASIFDAYGEREWDRHELMPHSRVSFEIHRKMLAEFVRPGHRVLDIGAGSGKYTIELARLGAEVTVGDVSEGQLALARRKVEEAGVADRVVGWVKLDVVDLSAFGDGSFEAVVCYGGPLSYVMDLRERAFDELLRVTTAGGHVLASVMSLWGTFHAFVDVEDIENVGLDGLERVIRTRALPQELSSTAPLRFFTWSDVERLVEGRPCALVAASAANFLSIGREEFAAGLLDDRDRWEAFLRWEVEACRSRGALDAGTHILFCVKR